MDLNLLDWFHINYMIGLISRLHLNLSLRLGCRLCVSAIAKMNAGYMSFKITPSRCRVFTMITLEIFHLIFSSFRVNID